MNRLILAALLLPLALPAAADERTAPAISVATAAVQPLAETVTLTGTLVARDEVMVGPELDSLRIVELLAEEGDKVAAGQVLARLSKDTIEAQLAQSQAAEQRLEAGIAQARSRIAEAQANQKEKASALERARTLTRSGVNSEATLDTRVAGAQTAEAQLASARDGLRLAEAQRAELLAQRRELMVNLGRTDIRAPAAGIVTRRTARLGAIAPRTGDALFRIAADAAIELEADVAETVLARLRIGQTAQVFAPGHDTPLAGRVRLVSPEVNRTSRLGRIRIAVDGQTLTLGAFGRGVVEIARRDGVAVPLSAVQFGAGGTTVQVVKDGVVETRPVTLGLRAGRLVEIAAGVAAGEQVVAISGTFLRNGDRVRAMPAEKVVGAQQGAEGRP
jgi:HlyD family secretion protein